MKWQILSMFLFAPILLTPSYSFASEPVLSVKDLIRSKDDLASVEKLVTEFASAVDLSQPQGPRTVANSMQSLRDYKPIFSPEAWNTIFVTLNRKCLLVALSSTNPNNRMGAIRAYTDLSSIQKAEFGVLMDADTILALTKIPTSEAKAWDVISNWFGAFGGQPEIKFDIFSGWPSQRSVDRVKSVLELLLVWEKAKKLPDPTLHSVYALQEGSKLETASRKIRQAFKVAGEKAVASGDSRLSAITRLSEAPQLKAASWRCEGALMRALNQLDSKAKNHF